MELIVIALTTMFILNKKNTWPKRIHHQGSIQTSWQAAYMAAIKRGKQLEFVGKALAGQLLDLLGVPINLDQLSYGILFNGIPGTAKTLSIIRLLVSIVYLMYETQKLRILCLDIDNQLLGPLLAMAPPHVKVICINPRDERTHQIDFSAFANSSMRVQWLIERFIPVDKSIPDKFWVLSARGLLRELMMRLVANQPNATRPFTLDDIVRISLNTKVIFGLIGETSHGRQRLAGLINEGQSGRDITAHVQQALGEFLPVAEALQGKPLFDLEEFVNHQQVLCFGLDNIAAAGFGKYCEIGIEIVTELCQQRGDEQDRTVYICEELARCPNLGNLVDLLATGRKHGVCPVYGCQSFDLIIHKFSDTFKKALLSLVQTVVQYKAVSADDAECLSKRSGTGENWQLNVTSVDRLLTTGQLMGKFSYSLVDRPAVMPAEILNQPPYDKVNDCGYAYVFSAYFGNFKVEGPMLSPVKKYIDVVPGLIKRDLTQCKFKALSVDDLKALGFQNLSPDVILALA